MYFFYTATSFIEFWKRRQAVIAWEWDLTNFEEEEQTRPEFEGHVKSTRINPVTRKHEPYLSPWDKAARVVFTNSFVFVMVNHITNIVVQHFTNLKSRTSPIEYFLQVIGIIQSMQCKCDYIV